MAIKLAFYTCFKIHTVLSKYTKTDETQIIPGTYYD